VQGEFLFEQSLYPELEYAFKHPLTREVAYGSLLRERRRELHGRTAEAVAARAGDAADAQAAVLAHHFEEAARPVDAASWHARAAERLGASGVRETLFHWRKVTELLAGQAARPEARPLLALARRRLVYAAARSEVPEAEVVALFDAALAAIPEDDKVSRAQLFGVYALVRGSAGHREEALRLLEEALATIRPLGERGLVVKRFTYGQTKGPCPLRRGVCSCAVGSEAPDDGMPALPRAKSRRRALLRELRCVARPALSDLRAQRPRRRALLRGLRAGRRAECDERSRRRCLARA
jgi:hypothetical protein